MSNPEQEISKEVLREQLNEIAESLYDPELMYHNFEHAQSTIEIAEEIIKR